MSKKILTVGIELPLSDNKCEEFRSKASLLDWDIVLFRPTIDSFIINNRNSLTPSYQGKPYLDSNSSFEVKECCAHWSREIRAALEEDKTIVVFLPPKQEVFVDSGQRTYSGTGKSQRTTTVVEIFSNYSALPVQIDPINATGSAIKLVPLGAEILAPYWAEFGCHSKYNVTFQTSPQQACLTTTSGGRIVGALIRSKASKGAIVILPDVELEQEPLVSEKNGKQYWTPAAKQFSARIVSSLVSLDKALKSSVEITPEPTWATAPSYSLATELYLRAKLLDAEKKILEAETAKLRIQDDLQNAVRLRGLLYEKGKPLEAAIIEALQLLGFKAGGHKSGHSEFDVVFESAEGRLLGEAEGKDSKAINVDKLRELSMNIYEDLQRDDVSTPAKGVLFGNGFRLTPPEKREIEFTEKCIIAARTQSVALIATSDLYLSARYMADLRIINPSEDGYAKQCREAMLTGIGIVNLPSPPSVGDTDTVEVSEEAV